MIRRCSMVVVHAPHLWDEEDRVILRWECQGVDVVHEHPQYEGHKLSCCGITDYGSVPSSHRFSIDPRVVTCKGGGSRG